VQAAARDSAPEDLATPRFGIIDWFPFGWVEGDNNAGMLFDMVAALDTALGVKSNAILSPVPRVINRMKDGEYDFTITYRDTNMLNDVDYLADMGCLRSAVISFRQHPVRSLDQLNGLRVAYPGGGYFAKRFLPDLNLEGHRVAQTYIMFRMALRGRLDAFIINDAVWQGYKNDLYPGFKVPKERWQDFAEPLYIETLPLAVSISKKSKYHALAKRMRSVMQSPAFVQELQSIYDKYQLPDALQCLPDFKGN
jgi:ABC-type amino acid transport substrate-binding protein